MNTRDFVEFRVFEDGNDLLIGHAARIEEGRWYAIDWSGGYEFFDSAAACEVWAVDRFANCQRKVLGHGIPFSTNAVIFERFPGGRIVSIYDKETMTITIEKWTHA